MRRIGKAGSLFAVSPTSNSCGIGFNRRRFRGCFGSFLHPRLMRVLFWGKAVAGCCYLMTNLPSLSLRSNGLGCAITGFGSRVCSRLSRGSEGLVSLFCLGFSGTGLLGLLGSGRTTASFRKGCSRGRLLTLVDSIHRNSTPSGECPSCLCRFVATCLTLSTRRLCHTRSVLSTYCCTCTVGYNGRFISS